MQVVYLASPSFTTRDTCSACAICSNLDSVSCPIRFQSIALDPGSMQTEVLYGSRGRPMGAGTVGLQVGRDLFVGSPAGDRILRVALDEVRGEP